MNTCSKCGEPTQNEAHCSKCEPLCNTCTEKELEELCSANRPDGCLAKISDVDAILYLWDRK